MSSLENALIGAVASSMANVTVYPLDLSKTLLQTQLKNTSLVTPPQQSDGITSNETGDEKKPEKPHYKNTIDCIIKIFKERGFFGLYQGMSASIVANFVQTFFYFFWYNIVRNRYLKVKVEKKFSTIEELSLGIVAAILSQVFTNPISVISTRQQTAESVEASTFQNVIRQILKESGNDITAFWKGFKVSMVLSINPSITYASYQKLKPLLTKSVVSSVTGTTDELSAGQNFVLGVVSKMISTMVTQPLIIAKTSLQRTNSKFKSFQEVLYYLYSNEGVLSLWKGLGPQLTKGVIVQGLLFMFSGEITRLLKRVLLLRSIAGRKSVV
ncbi:hypothetical protein Kpol_1050p95 [Vanderwaltozyma polyspora DSM 70294]|uniref:Peroxisomal adenine nucleotide transporter 1 n=1 Tax=Vanderwaltozyma polyspora (strain ATCC 22028 / DSM 70294 / BCRC 21397 / CBS 2163 / NBRC 10782 / NRRL Y-8283 / UCD 57-17) TaxID=436907 RepID=A7TEY9_VANPO|nr:uncharacterized protein Kpol_1050p95 [Vanderwaltozyma polyspora DSM 70294]EDO19235.1 hypothetical protein Kpol_1050p95 [Vanderwaltozyma polyspora DSM 70294]